MKTRHVIFLATTIGMFLASPSPNAYMTSQPEPQQQQLRRKFRYTCNGETIVVVRCRKDSDMRGYPPTKPEDNYCAVDYPDRPPQNGISIEKVELFADVVKKLQACGAFDQPTAPKPGNRSPQPLGGVSNEPAARKSRPVPAMTRAQADAYDKYFKQGNRYVDAKQYSEAVIAYKQAIDVLPDVSYAHNGLGLAYSNLGKYSEAVAELQTAIRLDPTDPTPCLNLGMTYFALGDSAKAITPLQQFIRLKPKDDKGHDLLGTAYKATKQYDKAVAAFREAVRLNPRNSSAWAGLGFSYYYLNRDPEAVSAFQQAISINPKDSYAYRGLGITYVGQGRKDEALAAYKTLLTLDKSEAQRLYESISKMAGETKGRSTSAPSNSVKTSGTSPSSPDVITRANALYDDKKYAEAIELYKRAAVLKLDTATRAKTHFRMGYSYFELKQHDAALHHLGESLRLNPNDPDTNFGFGYILYSFKQYPQALAAFQKTIKLRPSDAEAQYWVGEVYLVGLKQGDKAIPFFRESLRLRPNDARTLGELGAAYYFDRADNEAIAAFKEAIRLKPREPAFYYGLGLAYLSNEQKDDAMRVYQTLKTLDAEKAKALYNQIKK